MQTSWEKSSKWYKKVVGKSGHYYHQHIVIPNTLRLLHLTSDKISVGSAGGTTPKGKVAEHPHAEILEDKNISLIDLACGQGILSRYLPKNVKYLGIDISNSLVQEAKKLNNKSDICFLVSDISKPLEIKDKFTHATIILALQNIENQNEVIKNATKLLVENGQLLIVLNHPAFRIPRQSSWEIDHQNKLEYRRINRYLSSLKIPILTNPSDPKSPITWSFHHPLYHYFNLLHQNNFVITQLEEWSSDKESIGKAARMENRARSEFPFFLAILARKS